ncbi:MAG: lysylphosphatidylglycerol synthase transmembrane domain-containing protein [Alphaproteobacteria bacterium]|nr:lysylphosphatidylglycerol synthase transmembrane domain-containing protein [Alphaproteobacteria bacterium]
MLKKRLPLALKFLVSGLLIWFLLANVDLDAAKERVLAIAPGMVALATAIFLVQLVIGAMRWRAVLDAIGAPLPFARAVKFFFIGAFFSQTLPSSVGGDAVRIYKTWRAGLTLRGAVNGVMLERIAAIVALVALVAATQPFFLPRVGEDTAGWIGSAVALSVAATVAGMVALLVLDRLPASLRGWRLVRGLAQLGADARKVFLAPRAAGKAFGLGVAGHVNLTLGVYVLALGLKLEVTWVDCIVLFPPALLITTLPISIAGWGVREGAMVAMFALVGVPTDGALVLSILFGLLDALISLPGGVLWVLSGDKRADVIAAAPAPEDLSGGGGNG